MVDKLTIREWLTKHPEKVTEIIHQAKSYNDILLALGVQVTNTSARKSLKKFIEEHNLEEPNYNLYFRNLPAEERARTDKEKILTLFKKGETYLGTRLRKLVLLHNLIPYVCSIENCLLSQPEHLLWNGKEITLDLDHINGDNLDNRLENLRFLCPNCHSQTETYKGKNQKSHKRSNRNLKPVGTYAEQQAKFDALPSSEELKEILASSFSKAEVAYNYGVTSYALNLRLKNKPYNRYNKLQTDRTITSWGTPNEIIRKVEELGWEATGRVYGVSGNAVRKFLVRNEVDLSLVRTPHNSGRKKV